MQRGWLALCVFAAAGVSHAQDPDNLEIRGAVIEPALNLGVQGAEVNLWRMKIADGNQDWAVVATDATDEQGKFRFHPQEFGDYSVEVKKAGYLGVSYSSSEFQGSAMGAGVGATGKMQAPVRLSHDHPTEQFQFSFTLPGELAGRVVDEDGRPVANFRVAVLPTKNPTAAFLPGGGAVTDQDGYFVALQLPPGAYYARIGRTEGGLTVTPFSEDEFKVVDQDFETSYWPGGGADVQSIAPVRVDPGGRAGVGTLTLRKASYYRVHVSLLENCDGGEDWRLDTLPVSTSAAVMVQNLGTASFLCKKEFLVKSLKPGSYWFALSNEKYGVGARWSLTQVTLAKRNLEIKMSTSAGSDLRGRLVPVEGGSLPPVKSLTVRSVPAIAGLPGETPLSGVDAEGRFLLHDLPWRERRVIVNGLSGRYYLREIRVGGAVSPQGTVTLVSGAPPEVEIVIDDQAAVLAGTVTEGDKPANQPLLLLVRGPLSQGDVEALASRVALGGNVSADAQGRFQFTGLAPDEYRVLALPASVKNRNVDAAVLGALLNSAEKVTLERGGSVNLTVKLAELR